MKRRSLLKMALAVPLAPSEAPAAQANDELVEGITRETILRGRGGVGPTWFHPRACRLPDASILMTLQTIRGSDYFGPVHCMRSRDVGRTWTKPEPVPPLGWEPAGDKGHEGVCDVVPDWDPGSSAVLAMGHNVFYKGPNFATNQPPRRPIYAMWKDGVWGPRRALEWNDPRGAYIYSNGCGQRVYLPDGHVIMSLTFGDKQTGRRVCGVLASFEKGILRIRETGPPMDNKAGRGFLEPSVVRFQGRYHLTIRAEDNRGYMSVSDDGLTYETPRPWCWDDGTPLAMSTTQQHWLAHQEALYLVYTRQDSSNPKVLRWRSPLWMARVNPDTLRLERATERIVLPLVGDGVNDPDGVALMGNFHVTHASPDESWVTVGEWHPRKLALGGDVLLARIRWRRPNRV